MNRRFFELFFFLFSFPLYAQCIPYSFSEFQKQFSQKPKYFFSSWCPACEEGLKNAKGEKELVLVAFFDEKKAAEKVLTSLQLEEKVCVLDLEQKIAEHYQVKEVPAKR